jgi:mannitol-1-phosphate/altronate dehydrogenase
MVRERLELPKMRKKQKATSVKFAYDEVKQSVIKDCIAHNIKKFPENFYSGDPLEFEQEKFKIINSTGLSLHIDNFMGYYQIKDESGNLIHTTDNHLEAAYFLLYSKNKSLQILIPEKNKIVEVILKNYKSWLETLQDQIEENANHKLHNWSLAEKMTSEILDEYGLKN